MAILDYEKLKQQREVVEVENLSDIEKYLGRLVSLEIDGRSIICQVLKEDDYVLLQKVHLTYFSLTYGASEGVSVDAILDLRNKIIYNRSLFQEMYNLDNTEDYQGYTIVNITQVVKIVSELLRAELIERCKKGLEYSVLHKELYGEIKKDVLDSINDFGKVSYYREGEIKWKRKYERPGIFSIIKEYEYAKVWNALSDKFIEYTYNKFHRKSLIAYLIKLEVEKEIYANPPVEIKKTLDIAEALKKAGKTVWATDINGRKEKCKNSISYGKLYTAIGYDSFKLEDIQKLEFGKKVIFEM